MTDGTKDDRTDDAAEAPAPALTEEMVREAIRPVQDPEIGLSILDLGLVYGVEIDPATRAVKVQMTLTSQMCPAGPEILAASEMAVRRLPGITDVDIELVWTPPWDPRKHCSEDAKAFLGIWD
jgi:metal-sulfur cluster biosynthetic enzyme